MPPLSLAIPLFQLEGIASGGIYMEKQVDLEAKIDKLQESAQEDIDFEEDRKMEFLFDEQ